MQVLEYNSDNHLIKLRLDKETLQLVYDNMNTSDIKQQIETILTQIS